MRQESFFKRKDIKWKNVSYFTILHAIAFYGYITFPYRKKIFTVLWSIFLITMSGFGVTGGVHRLWSHQAYKAKVSLRIILLIGYLVAGQYPISWWVRDHRLHHKFTETEADPHNSSRGFWFSHIGWMIMKRHPEVIRKGRQINLNDIFNDPVVKFAEKYFDILMPLFCFIIPLIVPIYFWKESWYHAILSQVFMRYAYSLNATWSVNSLAHLFGRRPYDKSIAPVENKIVSLVAFGEGHHNYHHTFPADYKTAEFGNYYLNTTTMLIDFFSKIGWAYNLKQPSVKLIRSTILKRGDGSHPTYKIETMKEN